MNIITNEKIRIANGSGICPVCNKFFSIKKLDNTMLSLVNKHGKCPTCLVTTRLTNEKEETKMEEVKDTKEIDPQEAKRILEEKEARRIKRMRLQTIIVPEANDDRVIIAGPRGVTKHQMIAAINRNVDNETNLKKLASKYPTTFRGSLRYVKKDVREKALAIVGEEKGMSKDKLELIQKLQPNRKGVTYHQVIPALEKACEENDFKTIAKIRAYFPEQFNGSVRYLNKGAQKLVNAVVEKIKKKQQQKEAATA